MNTVPRRSRIDLFSPGERAIYEAMAAVESMGAHPHLTRAVTLLGEARAAVADFVDEVPETVAPTFRCSYVDHAGRRCSLRGEHKGTLHDCGRVPAGTRASGDDSEPMRCTVGCAYRVTGVHMYNCAAYPVDCPMDPL